MAIVGAYAPMPGKGVGWWLRDTDVAPVDDPSWYAASPTLKRRFWVECGRVAKRVYVQSRKAGLDRFGQPLAPLKPSTIAHRRSAMTVAVDKHAPPFLPGKLKSRTASYLRVRVRPDGTGLWCYFRFDPKTQDTWGRILHYHAAGLVPHAPVRDVLGFSAADRHEIRARMAQWWTKHAPKPAKGTKPQWVTVQPGHLDHGARTTLAPPAQAGPGDVVSPWRQKRYAPGSFAEPAIAPPKPIAPKAPVSPQVTPPAAPVSPAVAPPSKPQAKPTAPLPPNPKPKPKPKPQAKPAPQVLPPAATPAPAGPTPFPADPHAADIRLVKALGGSTGAELVEDANTGARYVRKRGKNADHLREETHADALYQAAGLNVPEFRRYDPPGGGPPTKLARFVAGRTLGELKTADPQAYQKAVEELREGFVADALLGNWDVVGMNLDNVLVDAAGKVWRIDNGGSLRFRAQGAPKSPSQWGKVVGELDSLRDPTVNGSAASVFGAVADADIQRQIQAILKKRAAILAAAPADLKKALAERLDYLAAWQPAASKYPIAGTWQPTPAAQFRRFATHVEMTAWGDQHYKPWAQALTKAEKAALRYYTGSGYSSLNKYLRDGKFGTGADAKLEKQAKAIDAAMAKQPLPEPVVAYRGFHLSALGLKRSDLKPGVDLPDIGFTSTSLDRGRVFSGEKFEIRVPAGAEAVWVNAGGSDTSAHPHELELLLGRNLCRLRVVEVRPDIIVVEMVPCSNP